MNFEKSEFFSPKVRTSASEEPSPPPLVRKMSALDNPFLLMDVFYGRPLTLLNNVTYFTLCIKRSLTSLYCLVGPIKNYIFHWQH